MTDKCWCLVANIQRILGFHYQDLRKRSWIGAVCSCLFISLCPVGPWRNGFGLHTWPIACVWGVCIWTEQWVLEGMTVLAVVLGFLTNQHGVPRQTLQGWMTESRLSQEGSKLSRKQLGKMCALQSGTLIQVHQSSGGGPAAILAFDKEECSDTLIIWRCFVLIKVFIT